MTEIFEPTPAIKRRALLWLSLAGFAAVVLEMPAPDPGRWKLPECEPLSNPFSSDFGSDFGAGVGMQCSAGLPASPKAVFQGDSVTIKHPDLPGRLVGHSG
jgi:hypothetical protein